MRISYRKIGGLHFVKLGTRYQLSICRLRSHSIHSIDALDSTPRVTRDFDPRDLHQRASERVTRFLASPFMKEAREVEGVLMGIICLPVIFIWSVTLIELADRMNWF